MPNKVGINTDWKERPTVLDEPDDILWAIETHVIGRAGRELAQASKKYKFAILYGNEDAPSRIEFWINSDPDYTDRPDVIWFDTGE